MIGSLEDLFKARNAISHELDLQSPEKPGDCIRRHRPIFLTKTICNSGFEAAELIVNAVGSQLT